MKRIEKARGKESPTPRKKARRMGHPPEGGGLSEVGGVDAAEIRCKILGIVAA
jgi:hypothetical protein